MNIWEFIALTLGLALGVWLSIKSEAKYSRRSLSIHLIALVNMLFFLGVFYLFRATKSVGFSTDNVFVLGLPLRLILLVWNLSYLAILSQVYLGQVVKRRSPRAELIISVVKALSFFGIGLYFFENIVISLPAISYALLFLMRILVFKQESFFRFTLPNIVYLIISFSLLQIIFFIYDDSSAVHLISHDYPGLNIVNMPLEWLLFCVVLFQNVVQVEHFREYLARRNKKNEISVSTEENMESDDYPTEPSELVDNTDMPLDSTETLSETIDEGYTSVQDRLGETDRTYTK